MSAMSNGVHHIKLSAGSIRNPQESTCFEKLNWLIHFQHVRGEINSCKSLIKQEIAESFGANEFAFFKQGEILRNEGKTQEALESFQMCLKLNPENLENFKEIGKCLYDMRRYRLALEAFTEAENVSKNPDWQTCHSIGECLIRLGEFEKAKEYAHQATRLGKHEMSYVLLIKILKIQNDFKAAITIANNGIASSPDSVSMLCEAGMLYLRMGQYQLSFERLSSALAFDPYNYKALLGVGCITQSHGENDVALTKYKLAVQYQPGSVALWNNIGICFYEKQKYVAAISCLKRALWISPLNWRVLLNLGLVHLATNQPASAFNFLCAAVNLRPDHAPSFMLLGLSLFQLQDYENALRSLHQATLLKSQDPTILINAALCAFKSGHDDQYQKIMKNFQDVLKISKENVNGNVLELGEALLALKILEVSVEVPNSAAIKDNSQNDQSNHEFKGENQLPYEDNDGVPLCNMDEDEV